MVTAIKIAYVIALGRRERRRLMFEYAQAYLLAQPALRDALRAALPASCVPAFDELIAAMMRADWHTEP